MKSESGLTWDDYKQMEFTQCVINLILFIIKIIWYTKQNLFNANIISVMHEGDQWNSETW